LEEKERLKEYNFPVRDKKFETVEDPPGKDEQPIGELDRKEFERLAQDYQILLKEVFSRKIL
jgi:hypothetical protein